MIIDSWWESFKILDSKQKTQSTELQETNFPIEIVENENLTKPY